MLAAIVARVRRVACGFGVPRARSVAGIRPSDLATAATVGPGRSRASRWQSLPGGKHGIKVAWTRTLLRRGALHDFYPSTLREDPVAFFYLSITAFGCLNKHPQKTLHVRFTSGDRTVPGPGWVGKKNAVTRPVEVRFSPETAPQPDVGAEKKSPG